jgi:hypothetical protein
LQCEMGIAPPLPPHTYAFPFLTPHFCTKANPRIPMPVGLVLKEEPEYGKTLVEREEAAIKPIIPDESYAEVPGWSEQRGQLVLHEFQPDRRNRRR